MMPDISGRLVKILIAERNTDSDRGKFLFQGIEELPAGEIQKCRIMRFPVLRRIGKFPRREIFSECGIDRRFAPGIGTRNQC